MKEEFENKKEGFSKEPEFGIMPLKLTNRKESSVNRKYTRRASKIVKTKRKIDRKLRKELLKNYGFFIDN